MLNIDKQALEQALAVTMNWNFDLAKEKLLESKGWSSEKADRAVNDYKKYMALMKAMDGYQLVPNEEIDEILMENNENNKVFHRKNNKNNHRSRGPFRRQFKTGCFLVFQRHQKK